jgi:hypothetical protein
LKLRGWNYGFIGSYSNQRPLQISLTPLKELSCGKSEFPGYKVEYARIDEALGSKTYFADPFSSWQRGSNENFNGLLRQYIPKKRPLSQVTYEELKMIERRLNNRPRKRLRFKTPYQVFHESLNRVALNT